MKEMKQKLNINFSNLNIKFSNLSSQSADYLPGNINYTKIGFGPFIVLIKVIKCCLPAV